MSDPIVSVAATQLVLPLPRPLVLGPMTVREREYVAVRVRTASGAEGSACCLSRGAPVDELIARLVEPAARGADATDPPAVWERVSRACVMVGRSGLFQRALGLLDVALWDALARRDGMPLWQLLGGERREVPAVLVAVYPTPDRSVGEMAVQLARYAEAGWPLLKLARDPDPLRMRSLLAAATEALRGRARLIVDVGFAWRTAAEGLAELRGWGALDGLAWLEDPLVPEDAAGNAAIRAGVPCPVGVGDEATDVRTYRDLVRGGAVDVLRLDVHAVGGITPAREIVALAREAGLPVSLHVSPETAIHVACGLAGDHLVETFDASLPGGNPLDPAHRLWSADPPVVAGVGRAPSGAGLGVELDPLLVRFDRSAAPA